MFVSECIGTFILFLFTSRVLTLTWILPYSNEMAPNFPVTGKSRLPVANHSETGSADHCTTVLPVVVHHLCMTLYNHLPSISK